MYNEGTYIQFSLKFIYIVCCVIQILQLDLKIINASLEFCKKLDNSEIKKKKICIKLSVLRFVSKLMYDK